jgi:uncharacterized surface protein with fasciclin (FAS1) repeats
MFKIKKYNSTVLLSALLTLGLVGCDDDDDDDPAPAPELTIAATANAVPELSSLYTAVASFDSIASALDDADGKNLDYTVFAPTNDAFDSLCETLKIEAKGDACVTGLVDTLTADVVAEVLTYHVLTAETGVVDSTGATAVANSAERSVPTLFTGNSVALSTSSTDKSLYVNLAKVTGANNKASNGIVHIIDKVLLPSKLLPATSGLSDTTKTIAEIAEAAGLFTTLLGAINTVGGDVAAAATNPEASITVFAPTDDAFKKIEAVLPGLSDAQLEAVLKDHILGLKADSNTAASLNGNDGVAGLGSNKLKFVIDNGTLKVGLDGAVSSAVTITDINASNGIIHVIDTVILPPSAE